MIELSYSQIQELLNQIDSTGFPKLGITVLRNITVEPIEPYLRYLAWKSGFDANVRFGEYDNIFQEATGSNPELFSAETNFVIVFLKLENLSWNLARNFNAMNKEQLEDEIARIEDFISGVLSGIWNQSGIPVI